MKGMYKELGDVNDVKKHNRDNVLMIIIAFQVDRLSVIALSKGTKVPYRSFKIESSGWYPRK